MYRVALWLIGRTSTSLHFNFATNDIFASNSFAAFAWHILFLAKNAKIKTHKERKEIKLVNYKPRKNIIPALWSTVFCGGFSLSVTTIDI